MNSCRIGVILISLYFGNIAHGIVTRDDVAFEAYTAYGALPQFASAGRLHGGTACATAGGVLVHPEWVLTAAHCIPSGTTGQDVSFHLGADASNPDLSVHGDRWFRHPEYSGNVVQGFDVGLVHLEQPILDVTPMRLYHGQSELAQSVSIVGYGRTGTGLTGENAAAGIRLGGENVVDRIAASGFHSASLLTDFDSPDSEDENVWGSATPRPLESAIALYDSGSPWFLQENGRYYVAGVSSFRSTRDGVANSDYRDISGAMRVSAVSDWIDANYAGTAYSTPGDHLWGSTGAWEQAGPEADSAVVIDRGSVQIAVSDTVRTQYVQVESEGRLQVDGRLEATRIAVDEGAGLKLSEGASLSGDLLLDRAAVQLSLNSSITSGSASPFTVEGTATLDGQLVVSRTSDRLSRPQYRGQVRDLVLMTADQLQGQFASIEADGIALESASNYQALNDQSGSSQARDGWFIVVDYDYQAGDDPVSGEQLVLRSYLALPGDANGDLVVDREDLLLWSTFNGQSNTHWHQADFNHDGKTDASDFAIWSANEGRRAPIDAPEPTGSGLGPMLLALLLLSCRSFSSDPQRS